MVPVVLKNRLIALWFIYEWRLFFEIFHAASRFFLILERFVYVSQQREWTNYSNRKMLLTFFFFRLQTSNSIICHEKIIIFLIGSRYLKMNRYSLHLSWGFQFKLIRLGADDCLVKSQVNLGQVNSKIQTILSESYFIFGQP